MLNPVYIYIHINLLSTSIHGYQEKRKKNRLEQEIKKYLESPPGGKRKNIIGQKKKKKRKGQFRHTSRKKSRNMQSVGQKKNKTHRKMPQCYNYKSAQYKVKPITKIKLNRESEFSYKCFTSTDHQGV